VEYASLSEKSLLLGIAMSTDTKTQSEFDPEGWSTTQIALYGPVLGGADLRKFLGFRTATAFLKARAQGSIGLPVFTLPPRRGYFAMTSEACAWLLSQRGNFAVDQGKNSSNDG
jgi:hypothetical protein